MPYYLYVPYKKKELPNRYNAIVEQWVQAEEKNNQKVIICYAGENNLDKLPRATQLVLLLPGKTGKPSPLSKNMPLKLLRPWESLSTHLRLKDEGPIHLNSNPKSRASNTISLLLPEIAEKMVADGLFEGSAHFLNIKLCFFDADFGTKILANAFFDTLLEAPEAQNSNIRLNYYDISMPPPPHKIDPATKKKVERSKHQEFIERIQLPTNSIFNNTEGSPQITLEQLNSVIMQYNEYKSSRCCGLSGILGLNGLFSSEDSSKAIAYLKNTTLSDGDRFKIASNFVKNYPHNFLTHCLKPVIETSTQLNHYRWAYQLHHVESGLSLVRA